MEADKAELPASWALYFPCDPFDPEDRRVKLIESLCKFLLDSTGWDVLCHIVAALNCTLVLPIDFARLCQDANIAVLAPAMEMQPAQCLGCLGAACYEVLFETKHYQSQVREVLGFLPLAQRINIRPYNVPGTAAHIGSIQSSYIGRLVTVVGTVVRLSPHQPLAQSLEYECGRCHAKLPVDCPDGRPKPPQRCTTEGCRSKYFKAVEASIEAVDWQKLRLQELQTAPAQGRSGAAPRTLDVEVKADCVNTCTCGDNITIVGFVCAMPLDAGAAKAGRKGVMLLYVEAVSVSGADGVPLRTSGGAQVPHGLIWSNCMSNALAVAVIVCSTCARATVQARVQVSTHTTREGNAHLRSDSSSRQYSLKELHFIVTYHNTIGPDQLLHLASSLCPAIVGQRGVKLALVLSLLTGAPRADAASLAEAAMPGWTQRSAAHILLLGDPGVGKSSLLRAAADAAPRGVFVSSMTSTAAGLTVSVTRDVVTNDAIFEAGALALADEGVCCLDELDQMGAEHQVLLEVMEQQQAVPGLHITWIAFMSQFPSLSANPIGGTFQHAKTVRENVKMSDALLSRFDLVFAMLDRANEAYDVQVSEHVMSVHAGRANVPTRAPLALPAPESSCGRRTLQDRAAHFVCHHPLPLSLMRQYIAYAKQHCMPTLSLAARHALKAFYLDMRRQAAAVPGQPVTTRLLESLVRLATARARADLRDVVTADDAEDVLDLFRESMRDFFRDGVPFARVTQAAAGSRGGKAGEARRLMQAIRQLAPNRSSTIPLDEIRSVAADLGIIQPLDFLLDGLNASGELLKRGDRMYSPA